MSGLLDLAHPWALAFALVIVFLVWAQRHSLADMTPAQRKVCLSLRIFIMLLLVLALAGVRWLLPSQELAVLFVVDRSASISAPAEKEARDFVVASLAGQHQDEQRGRDRFCRPARAVAGARTAFADGRPVAGTRGPQGHGHRRRP